MNRTSAIHVFVIICSLLSVFSTSCNDYCGPFEVREYIEYQNARFHLESSEYVIAPFFANPLPLRSIGEKYFDSPSDNPFVMQLEDHVYCHRGNQCGKSSGMCRYGCSCWNLEINISGPQTGESIDAASPGVVLKWTESTIDPGITGDPSAETEYVFESVRVEGMIEFISVTPVTEATFDLLFYDAGGNWRHIKDGWLWVTGYYACLGV